MAKQTLRPARVEINLDHLHQNIKNIKAKVGSECEIIGIIKADAYGHGALKVAEILRLNGVKMFGVATFDEAIALREEGLTEEILILGLVPDLYVKELVNYDLTAVTCSYQNALAISKAGQETGKTTEAFIALDTGMGRIGYLMENEQDIKNAIEDIKSIQKLPNLKIKGLFSHMATADEADLSFSKVQEEKFNTFYHLLIENGIMVPVRTFANSASIMAIPSICFEAVRPGIALYGCYPSDQVDRSNLDIKPVMSVKADIVLLKEVPSGFSVSYGRNFITSRKSKIATINLGYADGFPRPWSKTGRVIVNGRIAPIAGNICMDQCMIDVTDIADVKVGDTAIIMGSDGLNEITAEELAKAANTINYEILCGFGQRLPKVYV